MPARLALQRSMLFAAANCPAGATGNDRDALLPVANRWVLIVADGAQGRQGGHAADIAVGYVKAHASVIGQAMSCGDCQRALSEIDRQIFQGKSGGITTAVLIVLDDESLVGASVGDSEAHLFRDTEVIDLTERQSRRPFLGSGSSSPVSFGPIRLDGRLLVATDGLFKYGSLQARERIVRTALIRDVPSQLIDNVRLRDGQLQDDVTVYVLEPGAAHDSSG